MAAKRTTTKRTARKAASKKRRSTKAPSAKQLAARRKFALAAKARSKAAKAKRNPKRGTRALKPITQPKGWETGAVDWNNGPAVARHYDRESRRLSTIAKQLARKGDPRALDFAHQAKFAKQTADINRKNKPRAANKTVIVKPKRVIVLNGKATRRKYRNGYLDLVIRGTAEKTASGWKVGKKVIAQGKGIAPISSGYYLDKATGTVFAKRVRNSDHRDVDHPIEVTKHWRQGPPGYLTQWQKAHHAGQQGLFDHGIKAAKKRNGVKTTPKIKAITESFGGKKVRAVSTLNVSNGTPANLAKLGKLVLIKAEKGTIKPSKPVWLCADAKGKLHLATTAERLIEGGAQNFGKVLQVEYETSKPHLGYAKPTIFFHKMGEEGGTRPELVADGNGGLKFRGGSYRITREGIVN